MSNNLDRLFKKALLDKSCEPPPPYIWKNIERQLGWDKRRLGVWWWRSIAAAAAGAVFLGIWLLHSIEAPEVKIAGLAVDTAIQENKTKILSRTPPDTLAGNIPSRHGKKENAAVFSAPATLFAKTDTLPARTYPSGITEGLQQGSPAYSVRTQGLRRDFIPLTSKESIRNQKEYMKLLYTSKPSQDTEKRRPDVTVSGHFIPAYSSGSYSSSLKSPRGTSYSDAQMEGLMNAGGGIKVALAANKRFSVQTGLIFSRMGQKTSEPVSGIRSMALSMLRHSDKIITTPLGNIKTRTKAVAYRSPQAIVLNHLGKSMDETIEQTFSTLEIPLHARYLLNNNKVAFMVSGGFSGNFIVNNKVYLISGNNKEYMGSTEDIRNFNVSTGFSLGVEYPVTPKIRIMIEPGFKYYLQSLSQNDHIDFKPYLFTLSTGIGINF